MIEGLIGRLSVLSGEFRWDSKGLDIMGEVDIKTGNSFIQFPLQRSNLRFLQRTTSTAVSAYSILLH